MNTPRVPDTLTLDHAVLALDLDGTLLPGDFRLRPFTVQVLRALRRGGTRVVINTGRMFRSALPYALELGLSGPMCCYQGALIKTIGSGEVLLHEPLSLDTALRLLEVLESEEHSANVYVDDILYVEKMTEEVRRYLSIAQVEVQAVGRLSAFLTQPTTKIVVGGEPEVLDELAVRLRALFPALYIVKSLPVFLEIASPAVSKSRALAFLGERYGFGNEDVIAFGDSYNDTDALAWAATPNPLTGRSGLGVAMKNSPPEVKCAGNRVCGSVDEEGVAWFLFDRSRDVGRAETQPGRNSPALHLLRARLAET